MITHQRLGFLAKSMGVLAALPLLLACSTPYSTPRIHAAAGTATDFEGISQLARNQIPDVVFVHGMCTKSEQWALESIAWLNKAFTGGNEIRVDRIPVESTSAVVYKSRLTGALGAIRVSAILWSPIVEPLKQQVCYDQSVKGTTCRRAAEGGDAPEYVKEQYPHARAVANRFTKDRILNDCLVDAMIYQGKSRDEISKQVQKALLQAVANSTSEHEPTDSIAAAASATAPLVLVTESLGSKIAFDALLRLLESRDSRTQAAAERTLDRIAQVFMLANQLPMLALADQDVASFQRPGVRDARSSDPLGSLMAIRRGRQKSIPRVVAFTDPNDLLSYTLVFARKAQPYDVVDVVVSNDYTYFGLLERPDTAHVTYGENDCVVELLVHGTSAAVCKPQPLGRGGY